MVSVTAAAVPEQKTIKFDTMGRLALPSGAAAIFFGGVLDVKRLKTSLDFQFFIWYHIDTIKKGELQMRIEKSVKLYVSAEEENIIRNFVGWLEDLDNKEYNEITSLAGNRDLYEEIQRIFEAVEVDPFE